MAKCSRSNVKARNWMLANGYEDIKFFGHSRWSKDLHFQGYEFDGLASLGNTLVLFQVKSNCKATKKLIKGFKQLSNWFGISCLWLNCIDKKGLEINNISVELNDKDKK